MSERCPPQQNSRLTRSPRRRCGSASYCFQLESNMPSLAAGLRNRSRRHGRLVDHTNALRLSRPYRRLARDIVWCRSHNNPLPAYQHLHSGRGQAVVRRAAIMVSTATSPRAVFQSCVDIVRVNSRWPNRCEHKRQESTDQRPHPRPGKRDELAAP